MRGLGIIVLIAGVIWLIVAAGSDVSVATVSGGRVNNIGLMAERSNQTMIGGFVALAGLLMILFGGRRGVASADELMLSQRDARACPFCAEPINQAAILCKHCGSSIEPVPPQPVTHGWTIRIPCRPQDVEATKAAVNHLGHPMLPPDGAVLILGFYEIEHDAKAVQKSLRDRNRIHGDLYLPQIS